MKKVKSKNKKEEEHMAKVTKEELMHIANLADLNLKEEEIDKYLKDLEDILEFAEIVNKADTSGLEETGTAWKRQNVFRKDEVKEGFSKEELLQNAPDVSQGMFRIPKVMR